MDFLRHELISKGVEAWHGSGYIERENAGPPQSLAFLRPARDLSQ